jgi:hypothetical protein
MNYSDAYDAIAGSLRSWNFVKTAETSGGFDLLYSLGAGSYDCSEPDQMKAKPLDVGSFHGTVHVNANNYRVSQQDVADALATMKAQLVNGGQFQRIDCLF